MSFPGLTRESAQDSDLKIVGSSPTMTIIYMTDYVFIDSGVGGIPYMMKLLEKKPEASCIYVADTANFPYGEKSHEQVVDCVKALVQKICEKFTPKVIVIACNTMSVNALEAARKAFPDIQFVGTVPAIKLAASFSKKRRIGLLATHATCENPYNIELKEKFAADCEIINRPDPDLISFIEHNAFTASREECLKAVQPAVKYFREQNCDVMILGCTHFLNFTDVFEEAAAPDIKVVDSVDGVVRHAISVVESEHTVVECSRSECIETTETTAHLFLTSLTDEQEKNQYDTLCRNFGISFNGLI